MRRKNRESGKKALEASKFTLHSLAYFLSNFSKPGEFKESCLKVISRIMRHDQKTDSFVIVFGNCLVLTRDWNEIILELLKTKVLNSSIFFSKDSVFLRYLSDCLVIHPTKSTLPNIPFEKLKKKHTSLDEEEDDDEDNGEEEEIEINKLIRSNLSLWRHLIMKNDLDKVKETASVKLFFKMFFRLVFTITKLVVQKKVDVSTQNPLFNVLKLCRTRKIKSFVKCAKDFHFAFRIFEHMCMLNEIADKQTLVKKELCVAGQLFRELSKILCDLLTNSELMNSFKYDLIENQSEGKFVKMINMHFEGSESYKKVLSNLSKNNSTIINRDVLIAKKFFEMCDDKIKSIKKEGVERKKKSWSELFHNVKLLTCTYSPRFMEKFTSKTYQVVFWRIFFNNFDLLPQQYKIYEEVFSSTISPFCSMLSMELLHQEEKSKSKREVLIKAKMYSEKILDWIISEKALFDEGIAPRISTIQFPKRRDGVNQAKKFEEMFVRFVCARVEMLSQKKKILLTKRLLLFKQREKKIEEKEGNQVIHYYVNAMLLKLSKMDQTEYSIFPGSGIQKEEEELKCYEMDHVFDGEKAPYKLSPYPFDYFQLIIINNLIAYRKILQYHIFFGKMMLKLFMIEAALMEGFGVQDFYDRVDLFTLFPNVLNCGMNVKIFSSSIRGFVEFKKKVEMFSVGKVPLKFVVSKVFQSDTELMILKNQIWSLMLDDSLKDEDLETKYTGSVSILLSIMDRMLLQKMFNYIYKEVDSSIRKAISPNPVKKRKEKRKSKGNVSCEEVTIRNRVKKTEKLFEGVKYPKMRAMHTVFYHEKNFKIKKMMIQKVMPLLEYFGTRKILFALTLELMKKQQPKEEEMFYLNILNKLMEFKPMVEEIYNVSGAGHVFQTFFKKMFCNGEDDRWEKYVEFQILYWKSSDKTFNGVYNKRFGKNVDAIIKILQPQVLFSEANMQSQIFSVFTKVLILVKELLRDNTFSNYFIPHAIRMFFKYFLLLDKYGEGKNFGDITKVVKKVLNLMMEVPKPVKNYLSHLVKPDNHKMQDKDIDIFDIFVVLDEYQIDKVMVFVKKFLFDPQEDQKSSGKRKGDGQIPLLGNLINLVGSLIEHNEENFCEYIKSSESIRKLRVTVGMLFSFFEDVKGKDEYKKYIEKLKNVLFKNPNLLASFIRGGTEGTKLNFEMIQKYIDVGIFSPNIPRMRFRLIFYCCAADLFLNLMYFYNFEMNNIMEFKEEDSLNEESSLEKSKKFFATIDLNYLLSNIDVLFRSVEILTSHPMAGECMKAFWYAFVNEWKILDQALSLGTKTHTDENGITTDYIFTEVESRLLLNLSKLWHALSYDAIPRDELSKFTAYTFDTENGNFVFMLDLLYKLLENDNSRKEWYLFFYDNQILSRIIAVTKKRLPLYLNKKYRNEDKVVRGKMMELVNLVLTMKDMTLPGESLSQEEFNLFVNQYGGDGGPSRASKPLKHLNLFVKNRKVRELTCVACGKSDSKKICSTCKTTFYCSKECQRNHWQFHRVQCSKKLAKRLAKEKEEKKLKELAEPKDILEELDDERTSNKGKSNNPKKMKRGKKGKGKKRWRKRRGNNKEVDSLKDTQPTNEQRTKIEVNEVNGKNYHSLGIVEEGMSVLQPNSSTEGSNSSTRKKKNSSDPKKEKSSKNSKVDNLIINIDTAKSMNIQDFGIKPQTKKKKERKSFDPLKEQKRQAKDFVNEFLVYLLPSKQNDEKRKDILSKVTSIFSDFGFTIFWYGSVALGTYLQTSDIDFSLTISDLSKSEHFKCPLIERIEKILRLANEMKVKTSKKGKSKGKGKKDKKKKNYEFKDIRIINGLLPIVKCKCNDIVLDFAFENNNSICSLMFFESVSDTIGSNYLFKRSVVLIKAYLGIELEVVGGEKGYLGSYGVMILIVHVFNELKRINQAHKMTPFDILIYFLEYYSKANWKNEAITILKTVQLRYLDDVDNFCLKFLQEDKSISHVISTHDVNNFNKTFKKIIKRSPFFDYKEMNIVDPLDRKNNVGANVTDEKLDEFNKKIKHAHQRMVENLKRGRIQDSFKVLSQTFEERRRMWGKEIVRVLKRKEGVEWLFKKDPFKQIIVDLKRVLKKEEERKERLRKEKVMQNEIKKFTKVKKKKKVVQRK